VAFAEDQHPVGDLGPGGEHEPLRVGIRLWASRRDLDHFYACVGQDRVERRAELTEIHQQIADLLRSPRPVRVGGYAEDVDVAGADLHHEQAVQALEGHRAVHVEEVGGEHRRGLRVQELPPRHVGVPLRRRRDLQRPEDPADRGCADPVAELEQLTLDPLVAPAVVLGGEALDKRGDLGADRRSACPLRIRPFPGDQTAVPPQDGSRGDQPVCPQLSGQEPDQRGHDGSISPVEPGPGLSAAQHGDLVPQHQQFRVLGR